MTDRNLMPDHDLDQLLRPTSYDGRVRQTRKSSAATVSLSPIGNSSNNAGGMAKRQSQPLYGSPILPKLNKFKEKKPEYFETPTPEKRSRAGLAVGMGVGADGNKRSGQKTTGSKTAWAEQHSGQGGSSPYGTAAYQEEKDAVHHRRGLKLKEDSSDFVSSAMQSVQKSLSVQHSSAARDESRTRQRIIKNASHMVQGLPLPYLFSKNELRQYALEQVYARLLILARLREMVMLTKSFYVWKTPRDIECDDRQIGMIVISQAFQQLLDRMVKRAFVHWAIFFATRHNKLRQMVMNEAALDIQEWWKRKRLERSESYKRLIHAVKVCIQRRKAIKFMLRYEIWVRKSLIKITKGVVHRRRMNLAARAIQRVWRWVKWYRRVMWKFTRLRAVRILQQFWRMEMARPDRDHVIIKTILRAGGYSRVIRKVPPKLMGKGTILDPRTLLGLVKGKGSRGRRKNGPPPGLLAAVENCARIIQKAWMRYKGRGAMFAALEARREEEAREFLRHSMAGIIQNSYRAHLWDVLVLTATQHNRARRIQRQFRVKQYRMWSREHWAFREAAGWARWASVRERFLRRAVLWAKFSLRRQWLDDDEDRRNDAAKVIRRAYRAAKERERQRKIADAKRRAAMRMASGNALLIISKIQRNWRQTRETCEAHFEKRFTESRFPLHVKLVMANLDRRRRLVLFKAARKIQLVARDYLDLQYVRQARAKVAALKCLRRMFKACLLRLAVYRKVIAKRAKKEVKANVIKYWWRKVLFRHWMKGRFYLMQERLDNKRWVSHVATRLQRFLHQKWWEYYSPMRVVARYEIKKRLEREEAQRIWDERDRAARRIQKAFRGVVTWNKTLRRVDVDRVWYRRHNAARKIQKFFKMVVAWARFWTAADDRQARKEAEEERRRYNAASNIIGFYWRRWREKRVLRTLFTLRRKMLDEYYHLTDVRLKAEADRQDALDEVQRSEETMMATVASAWRQGSDTVGRNYFYNYITGESSWEPPEAWKLKPSEVWVRNKDERDNVYYYNMQTGESRWLPPCCLCGMSSDRWCIDCGVAYCTADFEAQHVSDRMKEHEWTNMETEKEALRPGETHCCECKKRVAKIMCTTCWDPYCAECFRYVHHIGALKDHIPLNYKKAKMGWICIKSKMEGERDYYVNGTTGETSYDKPEELMTPQEKVYWDNFKIHQHAAEDHVKHIEQLQFDLEAASYERDTIMFDAINGTGKIGQLLKNRQKQLDKGKGKGGGEGPKSIKKPSLFQRMLGNTQVDDEYRAMLMSPNPRERLMARDQYIAEIIDTALNGDETNG